MDGPNTDTVLWITHHFWGMREKLATEKAYSSRETRVCILPEPYSRTLADLHDSHQGIAKKQLITRATVCCPRINADITDYIKRSKIFTKCKASQAAQMMLSRDIPNDQWQHLAANFFTYQSKEYPLICDTFSKCPFIYNAYNTIKSVQLTFLQLILQYGPQKWLFTDNGLLF